MHHCERYRKINKPRVWLVVAFIFTLTATHWAATDQGASGPEKKVFRTAVEADWDAQERRRGNEPGSPASIRDALDRAQRLLENAKTSIGWPNIESSAEVLKKLRNETTNLDARDDASRLDLYRRIRWMGRSVALGNPLVADKPIAFLTRRRFICQMLHEYIGYYYDYGDISGGGVHILEEPGLSMRTRDLSDGKLPRGNFTTLALSYDAKTLYFAFAERAPEKPKYGSPMQRGFHIFAMDAEGGRPRKLTDGPTDDFDPCPLPDGGVAFMSSRRGGFIRCSNPWEPLPSHTLHRIDAAGENLRTLSFHETSEWHPSVLNDGRIVYIRWDYVDRSAANFHGLWVSNPDGSNPTSLFGNYTHRINACYQPRAIPGSNRIAFIAGAHHADVGGSLVLLDPSRARLDPKTGEDQLDSIEVLTPEVCFPEAPGWPSSYFHSPWPLSEDYFLVSFSFDPLPGMGPDVKEDTETGLYYFDRFGNMELLYRQEGISSMYPIPLSPRPTPPLRPSDIDPGLGDEGEFFLTDIGRSHFPLPASRPIRELRVFQVLPKTESHVVNQPRLGYANAESARMLLGTVPVEADGSAYFRAPSRKPLYFQAVDANGRAVQSMRSVTYLQPGERRGCIGCHESRLSTSPSKASFSLALKRAPSSLQPGPDGSRPISFPRLVQPVLDRHCTRCHDGSEGDGNSPLVLTGVSEGMFSKSYESLRPYVRWYEWGDKSISAIITRPGQVGADESRLTKILDDATHAKSIRLPREERQRLTLWLDANAPFYGVYDEAGRLAQQQGQAVPEPRIQ